MCGASIPPVYRPAIDQEYCQECTPGFKLCRNVAFHPQATKKIVIRPSMIHGWGAFLVEPVEKNGFITEYLGEVITQEEAERRGIVYDKLNSSFLFELNKAQSVDATRKGNKAKFINHSEENANCYPRIIQVNGDHKVALYAKRAIKAGEELFFNYLYSKHVAPDWAKHGRDSGSSHNSNRKFNAK
jgi:SET domain-containing protein